MRSKLVTLAALLSLVSALSGLFTPTGSRASSPSAPTSTLANLTSTTLLGSVAGDPQVCGDGIVDLNEECDDGGLNGLGFCDEACNSNCGDLDCNGSVLASDALRALRFAVSQPVVITCALECDAHVDESTERTIPATACADLNCDGSVRASDALSILRLAVAQPAERNCGFACSGSVCGDGQVCDEGWNCISGPNFGPEQCDDGNTNDDDDCRNDCSFPPSPCNSGADDPSEDPEPRTVTAAVTQAGDEANEVLAGAEVALSGSGVAQEPGEVELCWTIVSKPAGSTAELDDRFSATPTFVADLAGDYELVLRGALGEVISHPSRVTVSSRAVRTQVPAAQGERIVSADHALSMDIPADALDVDTEIAIELLRPEDLPEDLAATAPVAVYEFSPDGTEFDLPLDLEWVEDGAPGESPVFPVAIDGEDYTDTDSMRSHLSAEGASATWQTDHFSGVAMIRMPTVNVIVSGPVVAGVGQRFEISYALRAPFAPIGLAADTRREDEFLDAPQVLPPLPVEPVVEDLRYDNEVSILIPDRTTGDGLVSGRCARVGNATVAFEVEMSSGALGLFVPGGGFTRSPVMQLSAQVRCSGSILPPVATDDEVRVPFGTTDITISPLANDFDPDGKLDLTSIEVIEAPALGAAVANADGTISVTLGGNSLRLVDRLRYRVADLEGFESNIATVTFRRFSLPNLSPALSDDTFSVTNNSVTDLAVLANDLDPDGVLDPSTVQVTEVPSNGTATANADGTIRYEPTFGFLGTDTFRYQASDNRAANGSPALVTVEVQSSVPAPTAIDDTATTSENTAIDIDVLSNDAGDIDPTTLVTAGSPFQGTIEVVQPPMGNPVIRYTPAQDTIGQVQFGYRVANSVGFISNTASVRVFVTDPNNLPPTARPDNADTPRNTAVTVDVFLNDDDPDGFLTVGTEEIVSPPTNGTVEPFGFGAFRYTPNLDFLGTDTFTYRIADDQNAFSDPALVTITVFLPANVDPVASDDVFVVSPDVSTSVPVLQNDVDSDGTIDVTSVIITDTPDSGTAVAQANGEVLYTPNTSFLGDDSFSYTVADDRAGTSNEALVDILVRDFAGKNTNPVDNISAAQIHFFAHFASGFVDQGVGGFFGFNHADMDALDTLTLISDFTWWFEGLPDTGEAGIDTSFNMTTDLQAGVATFNPSRKIHEITGFTAAPIFPDGGGTLTIQPSSGGVSSDVAAPATLLDINGDPTIFRGPFDRFRTEVQFPDGAFTHLLLRAIELKPGGPLRGVLLRVPASELTLDNVTGMRHRPILDDLAIATLESMNFEPTSGIAVVFYNQEDNSAFFTDSGQRTVPLAAGRGVSLPAAQMTEPALPCEAPPSGVECAAGPREVLMAVNQNGAVTMHSPEDGSFLGNFLGGSAPNFVISNGWHLIQDPATNCLLFSDSGNQKIAKYDTDGSLIASSYIDTAGGASTTLSPRGLGFRNGELLVADNPLGRILRFDGSGGFVAELGTGLGRPNAVFPAPNGDVLYSDEAPSSTADAVRLVPATGPTVRDVIAAGLSTPYQISQLFEGNLAVANFGLNQIRIFDDGFPTVANRTIGERPPMEGNMNPRGIWPLRDGNWLATLSNGGGVAVLDPDQTPTTYVRTEAAGSTFRYISSVCLPPLE